MAEAARRRHVKTTPLHVAAALLAMSGGLLRQACVRSHPLSSHPLKCRALELCFSVALDRLPAVSGKSSSTADPRISNALMAALKRAQAHQRRGCPEQQQTPLLAVRVELEQLVVSILDDPSVSRIMGEASFSSPAVKTFVEESLSAGGGEVQRVVDILRGRQRRNPVLVGDFDSLHILNNVLRRMESDGLKVISLEKELAGGERILARIRGLASLIESRIGLATRFVVDIGDLKWLLESSGAAENRQPVVVSNGSRAAVVEMSRLLRRFSDGNGGLRIVGTANCATYLRCQVHHPSMEKDWDLQAVPITPKSPFPSTFSRLAANGIHGSSIGFPEAKVSALPSLRFPPSPLGSSSSPKSSICSEAMESQQPLPPWLHMHKDQSNMNKKSEELLKKWQQKCSEIHSQASSVPIDFRKAPSFPTIPPGFPAMTDLVLGRSKACYTATVNFPAVNLNDSAAEISEHDSFKRLFYGLSERVGWQQTAASAIATAVVRSKSGNKKQRSDTWMLFVGPDEVGKKKMAAALSEILFSTPPITIRIAGKPLFGGDAIMWGRTRLDRIADALRRNPFSVFVIEEVDRWDTASKGTMKRAVERGLLVDSHGREVSLGGAIFILTASFLPEALKASIDSPVLLQFEKILNSASRAWQLELSVVAMADSDNTPTKKARKELSPSSLSLDLNLSVGSFDKDDNGNSSDITMEHGQPPHPQLAAAASELRLPVNETVVFRPVDLAPVKRKVSEFISSKFAVILGNEKTARIGDDAVDRIAGGLWLAGCDDSCNGLEEWGEKVLVPGLYLLESRLETMAGNWMVELVVKKNDRGDGGDRHRGFLPAAIAVGGLVDELREFNGYVGKS
ncbi:Chaperone protein ClpB1 [Apostasia shenzhenica]|uniref:Chaperone protein ClpB1 n=1 Tax=Apostasia shenzhenica TaxID=1088818 RepID=A0A2I0A4Z6_9ASPA|nr:Chaperone protein ClpB1 [Apostasia shenzhenica]